MSSNIARPFAWSDTVITNSKFFVFIVINKHNQLFTTKKTKIWICYYCIRSRKERAIFDDRINKIHHKWCSTWGKLTTMNQGICHVSLNPCQYVFLPKYSPQTKVILTRVYMALFELDDPRDRWYLLMGVDC